MVVNAVLRVVNVQRPIIWNVPVLVDSEYKDLE